MVKDTRNTQFTERAANEVEKTEGVQLGSYEDAGPVTSAEVTTQVKQEPHEGFNMEEFDLNNAIAREYIVNSLVWNNASAQGTLLATIRFPDVLFSQAYIKAKIQDFRFFRGGVRLSIRVTANKFLYGKLLVAYNPDPTLDAFDPAMTLIDASGLPHVIVSASASDVVTFDVPFISPYRALDVRNFRQAEMGHFKVFVLNPLTSVTADIDNGNVVITAQFLEPKLYLPHDVVPQSGRSQAMESMKKAQAHSISSAHEVRKISKARVSNARKEVGASFTRVLEGAASMAMMSMVGLDKPTTTDYNSVIKVNPYHDISLGRGIDMAAKMSLDPDNAISTLPSVGGISDDELSLRYLAGLPSLSGIFGFVAATPKTEVMSLGPYDTYRTSVDTLMKVYRFWSGSLKFKAYITASQFHIVRMVFWLGEVSPTVTNWENCYHKVVDIQGDTEVSFTLPFTSKFFSSESNAGATWSVYCQILSWSQPDLAISAPIYLNVYKAGDSDCRFAVPKDFAVQTQCSPRQDFNKGFEPLHESFTGYEQHGYLFGEETETLRDVMHRYNLVSEVQPTTITYASYAPLAITPGYVSSGVERYGMFYRFWRGSLRFKNLYKDAEPATKAVAIQHSGEWISAINLSSSNNKLSEYEVPWYTNLLYEPTCSAQLDPILMTRSATTNTILQLNALGDDGSFHFARAPPQKLLIVAPPAGRGVAKVISFYN